MPAIQLPRDGVNLAVEWDGDGPAIIFAHGLTGTGMQSRRLIGALAGQFRVITFDQRGHGDSRFTVTPRRFDACAMAADIPAILDALAIERAVVGGASMGAATALMCALSFPERVARLVLVAPAFGDEPSTEAATLAGIGETIAHDGMESYLARCRGQDWPAMGLTEEAMAFRLAMLRSHDPASVAEACRAVARWVLVPNLAALRDLAAPTQIIAWEDDAVHPWALAERLAATLPHAELVRASVRPYHNEPGFLARLSLAFLTAI